MAYKYDYIKEGASVEWQKKADEIRQRDNYTCQVCGAQDKQVQVHHTWYNQNLHYWDYPKEQLITLCKDCHEKETELVRRFREIKSALDTNIINCIESLMKQGVLLTSVLNVFERMGTVNIMSSNNVHKATVSQSYHPASLSINEKKQRFLLTLQPFESKYDKDYIQTFIDYWLAENNGKLRFEVDKEGNTMNALGITSDYMKIKLENWKSEFNNIVKENQSALILDEFKKMAEDEKIEMRCRELDYRYYSGTKYTYIANITFDRWLGKLLFDRGLFVKDHYQYDSFLQKEKHTPLCNPITCIKGKEEEAFSNFCILYEAKQAFKAIKEYNRSILLSIDSKITYKSFCDKYGIRYGNNLKHDKSIKEMVESMKFPIQIGYNCGTISVGFVHTSNRNFLLKLNEIYGLKLLIRNWFIPETIIVPYKVLYQMDGTQFDFRDDSFENGTMKSIKLPIEYKDASFYIEKIEEIIVNNRY